MVSGDIHSVFTPGLPRVNVPEYIYIKRLVLTVRPTATRANDDDDDFNTPITTYYYQNA